MGAVYRVHSALTERLQAALKILKTRPDPEERARFIREAESLSALSHPGIVRVMAFGEDPSRGLPYLAMELAIGETLKSRLARGPLSPAEAVTAFAPLASALEHAHASGIYHRDVKPANVVLCRDGSVKLVDFGIATNDDWDTLDSGGHLGTLPYLPPEIFRGERPDPKAIDVYGVGLMLYEALTGTRPFQVPPGMTPAAVAAAIGARKLQQQSFDLGENVPPALRGAVLAATHPLPAERPTMRVLREAIDSLRAAISDRRGRVAAPLAPVRAPDPRPPRIEEHTTRVPEPAGPAVNEPATKSRRARSRERTRRLLIAAGIAILVLAALVAALARRRSSAAAGPSTAATPPPVAPPRQAGDQWVNSKDGLTSVWIPPGKFSMGCTPGDDRCDPVQLPSREITFDAGFLLSRTEVTVGAYKTFARQTATRLPDAPAFNDGWRKDDHPIVNVTWDDARAYCAWAGGRLPSEAEWEYAARGGHADWFHPWGRESPTCTPGAANGARFDDGAACRKAGTERVGAYGPNGFGLLDAAGNAWEWCADEWNANYSDAPSDGSAFEEGSTASRRVLRGGSWINGADYLRVSIRSRWFQSRGREFIGFRCARDGEAERP